MDTEPCLQLRKASRATDARKPPSLRTLAPGAWHHAATARATAMARGRISRSHGTGGARKPVSGRRRQLKLPAGGKFIPAPKPSRGNCKPNSPRSPGAKPDFRGRDHRRREPPSRIDLDGTKEPVSFVRQVLDRLPEGVPAFGKPIGFVINYSPGQGGQVRCKRATSRNSA